MWKVLGLLGATKSKLLSGKKHDSFIIIASLHWSERLKDGDLQSVLLHLWTNTCAWGTGWTWCSCGCWKYITGWKPGVGAAMGPGPGWGLAEGGAYLGLTGSLQKERVVIGQIKMHRRNVKPGVLVTSYWGWAESWNMINYRVIL